MLKLNTYRLAICGGLLAVATAAVQALPLNLTPQPPEIVNGFVEVVYDADTDLFTASGIAGNFDLDGLAPPDYLIELGEFTINATVNSNGVPSHGSLLIEGLIEPLGASSGMLLAGTLTDFGFPDTGPGLFEFLFNVTEGDLAPQFNPQAGVILDAQDVGLSTGFTGSFTDSFSNRATGNADVFGTVIPEPHTPTTTALGLATLIAVCIGVRRTKAGVQL